jgi:DNA-binding NarL/FixJ family response regulator
MSTIIRVGIAEDQTIFREGLMRLVDSFENINVVLDAENGKILIDKLEESSLDVVLLDYRMPELNGLETAIYLKENFPEIRIIILSMYDDEEFIINTIENGAHGYLTKNDDPEEIEKAILSTMSTGYYINDRTSKLLIKNLLNNGKVKPEFKNDNVHLTAMELEVISLICQEFTAIEIANKIFRSSRTVEGIRTTIMRKIGARNSIGIVMYAVKNKLISIN